MTTDAPLLVVPGIGGSGPDHWQSVWERVHPGLRRVVQRDWDRPDAAEWAAALESAVAASPAPPVLLAHSLGCLLVARWATAGGRARGALLVAPPDPAGPPFPAEAASFAEVPRVPLPFPAVVVASRDDPCCTPEAARDMAACWGADVVDAGRAGHLNSASGLGEWPSGWALVAALVERTAR